MVKECRQVDSFDETISMIKLSVVQIYVLHIFKKFKIGNYISK